MQAGDSGAAGAVRETEGCCGEADSPPAEAPGAEGGCGPALSQTCLEHGWNPGRQEDRVPLAPSRGWGREEQGESVD